MLRARGVPVGLGADGPPCNNRLSIFHEMSLAATLHSLRSGPAAIGCWEALAMATREGAAALRLDDEIGTLAAGKAADLAVVSLDGWAMLPDGDPAARIVYGGTVGDVRHTVVAGRPLVVDGVLEGVVEDELRTRVRGAWIDTRSRMEAV
jgi:5-methylthioadenosine/S-adenosylhomocysteine deaminase